MANQSIRVGCLKRVAVVGTSGSGKTTFAKNLAQILNVKHIELDAINWLPDWVERPHAEFIELVKAELASDSWVLDGNYSRTREAVWKRATAIVWLNYSFPLTFYRAFNRTTRRIFNKEILYSGNRETFGKAFMSKDSILLWVLSSYRGKRRNYSKLLRQDKNDEKEIFIFQNPKQTERFLLQVKEQTANLEASNY